VVRLASFFFYLYCYTVPILSTGSLHRFVVVFFITVMFPILPLHTPHSSHSWPHVKCLNNFWGLLHLGEADSVSVVRNSVSNFTITWLLGYILLLLFLDIAVASFLDIAVASFSRYRGCFFSRYRGCFFF